MRANKQSVAQDWAAHSFSGGRIELIRPGVHCDPSNPIYQYDICSAYPSIIAHTVRRKELKAMAAYEGTLVYENKLPIYENKLLEKLGDECIVLPFHKD